MTALSADELAQARELQEAAMPDTVRVERLGAPVFDRGTLTRTGGQTTLYEGQAGVGEPQGGPPVVVAGALVYPLTRPVRLPWSVTGVQPGDRVTVLASANDPDLVGDTLWVRDVPAHAYVTARRLICTDEA